MPDIVIYTKSLCSYCIRAKKLLTAKGVAFREIAIDGDMQQRARMIERSGGRQTAPQIFIDEQPIGGCDDLFALEQAGRLDSLLSDS